MESYILEPMSDSLLPEAVAIYNHYISKTTATFHTNEITASEMKDILFDGDPRFPAFAVMEGEKFCGYCILARYKKRQAYDRTGEVTIYLKPGHVGRGIGSYAVRKLEEIARRNGFHTLLAGISGENTASIRLFTTMGYYKCAHIVEAGQKFGRWIDVVYYQKLI